MITAHKVLAAYACLAPRVVTGQFDPTRHRAIWPSTGNYARGRHRDQPDHGQPRRGDPPRGDEPGALRLARPVVREPGRGRHPHRRHRVQRQGDLRRLQRAGARTRANFVLNQFCEFGNHLAHYEVTGRALAHVFDAVGRAAVATCASPRSRSATGSAGTIAAGDRLKEQYGTKIVAVEALECPTLLENGFGEHNIQGIGDKHVPLIHNVMNTDVVVARQRSGDRPAPGAVQHATTASATWPTAKASTPARSPRSPTSGSRRSATCWPRSRRPSCSASAPTTPSSPSPPTAGRCTRASGPRRSRERFGGGFTHLDAAAVWGPTSPTCRPRT